MSGAKFKLLFALLLGCVCLPVPSSARPGTPFPHRFAQPPAESRIIKIIHSWPDQPTAQDALIRSLSTQGFGGVVCNVSFSDYLQSGARWADFKRAVLAAKEAGFSMWLYDEKGYPSAAAGGLVLREHPEWEARGLLIADAVSSGDAVNLEVPPGKPVLAAAFLVHDGKIDLKTKRDLLPLVRERKFSWTPTPAAENSNQWHVIVMTEARLFEGTHASMSLSEHIPYPNLLQPEPTARFIELTHQRYADCLGKDLGRCFVATFTDEPSLMSLFLRRMPYRVLPWAPGLAAEFKKRHGCELEPLLPALVTDAGPDGARARYQFWEIIGELVSENFFGQIQQWCAKHDILSGGHLLMEENLVNHVPLYGDFFRCLRRLDAPSIDCLTSIPEQVPWHIARLAASAAELENKTVTMCETSDHSQRYRPAGDQRPLRNVTEQEIRGTCNRLIAGGIDTITSYYSFAGLADDTLRRLNEWVGRCCTAVTGGHHVSDIAVLYPVESVWARFTPARHMANDSAAALQVESMVRDVSDTLYHAARDFAYVDSRALTEAKVENGALVHGKLRWRVVILPGADTLPLAAWENLLRFVKAGGVVVGIGNFPANSERDFPSPRVQDIAKELFGSGSGPVRVGANPFGGGVFLTAGSIPLLPRSLKRMLEPDLSVTDGPERLRYTHRQIGGKEVYFVINDSKEAWQGKVDFAAMPPGEQWDPASGKMTVVPGAVAVPLSLEAYGAAVFRFPSQRGPQRRPVAGVDLGTPLKLLPPSTPLLARGEFVREELVSLHAQAGKPEWTVTGTITRSDVDTFLFVRLPFAKPLDLRNAQSLVLETSVPETQRTPNQLLLILHEQDGADYYAATGRTLGTPGLDQSWIPLTRFQLAGWSEDRNSRLDLDQVTEIRVGWGGYLGTAGEKVQFTLAPLLIGDIRN
jgi:hypothetical protein